MLRATSINVVDKTPSSHDKRLIPTQDELLAALDRTGFLFEQKVADLLGESSTTGWAFEDSDSGISREIDVYRQGLCYERRSGDQVYELHWHVLAECKSSAFPWVGIGTSSPPPSPYDKHLQELEMTVPMRIALGADKYWFRENPPSFNSMFFDACFRDAGRAVQLLRVTKKSGEWDASNAAIHDSITYPLAKAADSLIRQFHERYSREHGDIARPLDRVLWAVFPVLVVSAPILLVGPGEGGFTVSNTSHLSLERTFQSTSIKGRFRMHVVNVDYLRSWYSKNVLEAMRVAGDSLGFEQGSRQRFDDDELYPGLMERPN